MSDFHSFPAWRGGPRSGILFRVIQPGLFTTVQGLGRGGRQQFGIAPGGAADITSLRIANALVRNPASAPALEITLTGPTLELLVDSTIALAGANLSATIDGHSWPNYHSVRASAGSKIAFGRRVSGARAYLAVDGGIVPVESGADAPHVDGSAPVKTGDIVYRAQRPRVQTRPLIHLATTEIPAFDSPAVLRVLEGPHWIRLSSTAQAAFLGEEFAVDLDSNRVGIRLSGPSMDFEEGQSADILSEPTPSGTIQLPVSGHPIILMTDRPTTGGYAKIATVITADIPRAAQLAPADSVHFQVVSLAEAQAALKLDRSKMCLLETVATW